MVAMLILSIGLLGVQGLMIRAARLVASAARRTEVALAVGDALEMRLRMIAVGSDGGARGEECETGDGVEVTLCTEVESHASAPALPPGMLRVTVRGVHRRATADTFTVVSHVLESPAP